MNKETERRGEVGVDSIKESVTIVGELVKVAADTPQGKVATSNIGDCAVIITETIKNSLLPLVAINKGFEKTKKYFEETFHQELAEKSKDIKKEDIVEPKPSVAGPAMQGLSYSHEEKDLKEMYLSLLITAMDRRVSNDAHPSFVEIIKQLDSLEAKQLKYILPKAAFQKCPIVRPKLENYFSLNQKINLEKRHIVPFKNNEGHIIQQPKLIESMFDNWVRLALIDITYDKPLAPENYKWALHSPDVLSLIPEPENSLEFDGVNDFNLHYLSNYVDQGYYRCTTFGIRFAKAVGLV